MIAIPPPPPPVTETCLVSWHDGQGGTASGEEFDPLSMTAAHKTLPFDTLVKVSRANDPKHRSVVVRINDRFSDPTRCLNLAKAAFEELAPLGTGIIKVTMVPVASEEEDYSVLSDGPS